MRVGTADLVDPGGPGPRPTPGPPDPYRRVRATPGGQLMLPLEGLTRRPRPDRPAAPSPDRPAGASAARRGRQLALPLQEGEWPENRPILGRDGQYRLPMTVPRVPRPAAAGSPVAPPVAPRSQQLRLPLAHGDWPENRPVLGADGQYRLPLQVRRSRPATSNAASPERRLPRPRRSPLRHGRGHRMLVGSRRCRGDRRPEAGRGRASTRCHWKG